MNHFKSIGFSSTLLLPLLCSFLFPPSNALAEMYVAGMLGYAAPNPLTNIRGTGGASGITLSELDLNGSFALGAKLGFFFPTIDWLGIETEIYGASPDVKQQSATASGFGVTVPTGTLPGFRLDVVTWGINLMARYPGKTFQPYAGVGLGVFFAEAQFQGQSDSDVFVPGLNALAGLRIFVTDHVALFGEYKYNRATFNLPDAIGFQADYSANLFMGGVSFHF